MTHSRTAVLLVFAFVLTACGQATDPAPPAPPAAAVDAPPEVADSDLQAEAAAPEQTWLGVLPCADCDGIQTRLTLSSGPSGQRYVLQETYLDASGGKPFEQSGEWTEDSTELDGETAALYHLDPQGAGRWFWRRDDGALELLLSRDASAAGGVEYRLQPM